MESVSLFPPARKNEAREIFEVLLDRYIKSKPASASNGLKKLKKSLTQQFSLQTGFLPVKSTAQLIRCRNNQVAQLKVKSAINAIGQ